jgi:hypothetical protein
LENYGIENVGIKFSGSKGFHLIVPWQAFPKEFSEEYTKDMFPEWPRNICKFLMHRIKPRYNREVAKQNIDFGALEKRTNLREEDLKEAICPECGRTAKKGKIVKFICPICNLEIERKDPKLTKRKLKCLNDDCAGVLEVIEEKDYFHCEYCGTDSWDRQGLKKVEEFEEGISGSAIADLDLILVAPRHLFRMPYSLHEKTALASVVLEKSEIDSFEPRMADPMKVKIKEFIKPSEENSARRLLQDALFWAKQSEEREEEFEAKKYSGKKFEPTKLEGVEDRMFPKPIKKLLKGLGDGKKRGLFILLTFFRSCGFSPEEINKRVKEWNEKNDPKLKEGYIKSQLDWHLKQRKRILPPNYSNDSFWRDLGLLEEKPKVKNPIVEVARKLRNRD